MFWELVTKHKVINRIYKKKGTEKFIDFDETEFLKEEFTGEKTIKVFNSSILVDGRNIRLKDLSTNQVFELFLILGGEKC